MVPPMSMHCSQNSASVPLIPLPIITVPFKRIGMDLLRPLPKSDQCHKYILVIMDYISRYLDLTPVWKTTS